LPDQAETNPRGYVNAISIVRDRLEESPVMVLQAVVSAPTPEKADRLQSEGRATPVEMRILHLLFVLISHEYPTLRGWLGPSYFILSPSMPHFWRG